jgi:hypothetical protein
VRTPDAMEGPWLGFHWLTADLCFALANSICHLDRSNEISALKRR